MAHSQRRHFVRVCTLSLSLSLSLSLFLSKFCHIGLSQNAGKFRILFHFYQPSVSFSFPASKPNPPFLDFLSDVGRQLTKIHPVSYRPFWILVKCRLFRIPVGYRLFLDSCQLSAMLDSFQASIVLILPNIQPFWIVDSCQPFCPIAIEISSKQRKSGIDR